MRYKSDKSSSEPMERALYIPWLSPLSMTSTCSSSHSRSPWPKRRGRKVAEGEKRRQTMCIEIVIGIDSSSLSSIKLFASLLNPGWHVSLLHSDVREYSAGSREGEEEEQNHVGSAG